MECKIIYDNDGKEIKRTVGNAVLVQDIKIGGYTAYFKQLPNIIAEGDTDNEAMKNLTDAVYDVFMFKVL